MSPNAQRNLQLEATLEDGTKLLLSLPVLVDEGPKEEAPESTFDTRTRSTENRKEGDLLAVVMFFDPDAPQGEDVREESPGYWIPADDMLSALDEVTKALSTFGVMAPEKDDDDGG